jgi:hypothetical protein
MEQLVEHMQKTLHFNQLANSSTPTKSKSPANSPAASPVGEKNKSNGNKGTFSFKCLLCGHSSASSIDGGLF